MRLARGDFVAMKLEDALPLALSCLLVRILSVPAGVAQADRTSKGSLEVRELPVMTNPPGISF